MTRFCALINYSMLHDDLVRNGLSVVPESPTGSPEGPVLVDNQKGLLERVVRVFPKSIIPNPGNQNPAQRANQNLIYSAGHRPHYDLGRLNFA